VANPPAAAGNQFAYVVNYFGDNVQAFTSDGNGNLTLVGNPITVGSHPHNVNVDKAGRFVYISNHDSNFVSGYTINSSDGSLIPINPAAGSPVTDATDPTNNNPHWSAFDQTGQFLYVIAGVPPTPSTLKSYSVNGTTGVLTQIGTTGPLVQCAHGHNVIVTPNNNFLYVACEDSAVIYSFRRDTNTGQLTNLGATVVIGQNGTPPTAPSAVADPTSSFLFVGATNSVTVFNINPNNGTIAPIQGQSNFVSGNSPHNLTLDSNGHLYTANLHDSTVSVDQLQLTRTGELWAHAIDICQATGRPLPQLDPERMAALCNALMAAVPLAMAYRGTTAPGRAARFVLTGPAGGIYTVPLAPLAQAAEPAVTIVTDATGLCQVAVRRLRPEQLEAAIDGDRELGDLVLAGIGSLARD